MHVCVYVKSNPAYFTYLHFYHHASRIYPCFFHHLCRTSSTPLPSRFFFMPPRVSRWFEFVLRNLSNNCEFLVFCNFCQSLGKNTRKKSLSLLDCRLCHKLQSVKLHTNLTSNSSKWEEVSAYLCGVVCSVCLSIIIVFKFLFDFILDRFLPVVFP